MSAVRLEKCVKLCSARIADINCSQTQARGKAQLLGSLTTAQGARLN